MDRFHHLLVYLSADQPVDAVVRTADDLAHRNQADVTLVDVVESSTSWFRGSSSASAKLEKAVAQAATQRLEEVAGTFEHVQPSVVVRSGVDFIEVINQIYEGEHDLVLVGSHPRSSAAARIDPTLTHLLRKGPVPVWVVDPEHRVGDVLVAIGPELEPDAHLLNRTLVEIGSSLADRMGAGLHLTHSWRLAGESLLRGSRVSIPQDEIQKLLSETEESAQRLVDLLVSEVPAAARADVHVMHGRPELRLIELTDKLEPAVVVMGTVARKGIAGLIVGNTAERVLTTVDTSLIAVKPPWFVSPVPPPDGQTEIGID